MENLRGAALMVLAMGLFAVEDALIKGIVVSMPAGQVIAMICAGGVILFVGWFLLVGVPIWQPEYLNSKVLLRSACDAAGTAMFVTALTLVPLTTASAVIQATPLVVAMGAALFLGQEVGWRRWLAIIVGFVGVMIILRPGTADFDANVLFAVGGMLGLASRDLLTRSLTVSLTGPQLATHSFAVIIPVGFFLCWLQGQPLLVPDVSQTIGILAAVFVGAAAYLAIVAATRTGNAAIISSFRYSRMLFALILGFIFFSEAPDIATIIGVTIIIASGLYTLAREARLRRASLATQAAL